MSKLNPIVLCAFVRLKEVHQQSLPVIFGQLQLIFQSFPFQLLPQVLQGHEKEGFALEGLFDIGGLFDNARHTGRNALEGIGSCVCISNTNTRVPRSPGRNSYVHTGEIGPL
jgi:hypothetical protein